MQLVPAMEEGGVERYITTLNRILVEHGWENCVVSSGGKLEFDICGREGRTQRIDLKSKNPLTAPLRAWRLRRLILAEKPDVVVAHSRVPAWLFAMARTMDRLLAAGKGGFPRLVTYAHGANSVSRYSRVMTAGEVVMCPSNFIRDYLTRAYGTPEGKFRVIPHAVDFDRFDPGKVDREFVAAKRAEWGIRADEKVVMCVGRISPLKGLDNLMRELAAACAADPASRATAGGGVSVPSLRLIIVGGAEKKREAYFDSLRQLAAALQTPAPNLQPPASNLQPSLAIVFAGPQTKIPECLALADVVVSANVRKPESFGLSMAEALAMGKPVVARGFGGALDIVRDGVNGVFCEPGGFAAAIAKALTLPTADIRADAVRRFDYSRMAADTIAVYDSFQSH